MPIRFDQPVPVDLAGAYGEVQQRNVNEENRLRMIQMQSAASQANANRSAGVSADQARLSLQAQLANQSRNATPRDAFQAQQQQAMQQAGFQQQQQMLQAQTQAHQYLQQQDWTHADEIRFQQASQGKAAIQVDPELDDVQKAAALAQYDEMLSPMQNRKAQFEQKMMKEQINKIHKQAEIQAAHEQTLTDFRNGVANKNIQSYVDPDTGVKHHYTITPDGKFMELFKPGEGGGDDLGGTGQGGTRTSRGKPAATEFDRKHSRDVWSKFYTPHEGGPTPESEEKVRTAIAKDEAEHYKHVKQQQIEDTTNALEDIRASAPIDPATGKRDLSKLPEGMQRRFNVLGARLERMAPKKTEDKDIPGGPDSEKKADQTVNLQDERLPPLPPGVPKDHYERVDKKMEEFGTRNAVFEVDGIQYLKKGGRLMVNNGPPVEISDDGQFVHKIGTIASDGSAIKDIKISLDPHNEELLNRFKSGIDRIGSWFERKKPAKGLRLNLKD